MKLNYESHPSFLPETFKWDVQDQENPIYPEKKWSWLLYHEPTDKMLEGYERSMDTALSAVEDAAESFKKKAN